MKIPENEINHAWITAGSSSLWGTKGTYSSLSYDRLPSPPSNALSFAWLKCVPDREYSCTLASEDNNLGNLPEIEAELEKLGFHLPNDFAVFIREPNIYARIPSCTACYLELSEKVIPVPEFPGSFVVRFMNDSQCCFMWYLLFQPSLPARVLATTCFIEQNLFEIMEYLTNENQPLEYKDVLKDSRICAESFGEFIYRFGIENMIWYATHAGKSLSPIEQVYLEEARR